MGDEELIVKGVSRAMAMLCEALVSDDAAYRQRTAARLERAVKVCAEHAGRAPELVIAQRILLETLTVIQASDVSGARKPPR